MKISDYKFDKMVDKMVDDIVYRITQHGWQPASRYAIYDKETICIFWGVLNSGEAIVEFQSKSEAGFRYRFEKVDLQKVEIIAGHENVDFDELKNFVAEIPNFKEAFK